MAALATIEMRMRLVVVVGRHAVEERTATAADAFSQPVTHQEVQNTIDRYAVYRRSRFQGSKYLPGTQWAVMVADNFQDLQPVLSETQTGRFQQRRIITSKAHLGILEVAVVEL